MQREIKFRAFDDGKMIYQNQTIMTDNTDQLWYFFKNIRKDAVIMQFTGLIDKNGKEIFEGDIVFNSNRTLITMNEDKRLYLVKWQEGEYNNEETWLQKKPGFVFEKIITDGKKYMDLIFSQEQIEVVGNVFENPELLGVS